MGLDYASNSWPRSLEWVCGNKVVQEIGWAVVVDCLRDAAGAENSGDWNSQGCAVWAELIEVLILPSRTGPVIVPDEQDRLAARLPIECD